MNLIQTHKQTAYENEGTNKRKKIWCTRERLEELKDSVLLSFELRVEEFVNNKKRITVEELNGCV